MEESSNSSLALRITASPAILVGADSASQHYCSKGACSSMMSHPSAVCGVSGSACSAICAGQWCEVPREGYCSNRGCGFAPQGGAYCNSGGVPCKNECLGTWCSEAEAEGPGEARLAGREQEQRDMTALRAIVESGGSYCGQGGCHGRTHGSPSCQISPDNCNVRAIALHDVVAC